MFLALLRRLAFTALVTLSPGLFAATVDVVLEGQLDDTVIMRISGSGADFDGTPEDNAFQNIAWSNLQGGKALDPSLRSARFDLVPLLPFATGIDLVAITLDDDGGQANADDFAIWFEPDFDYDDPFDVQGEALVQGLSFGLLTEGVYTSSNAIGTLSLTITAVPLPPALLLFGGAVGAMAVPARRRRRQPAA